MRFPGLSRLLIAGFLFVLTGSAWAAHGLGMGYEPKYPADFKNFDYVNPDAPKGGHLTLSASGSFDKLNPFTLRGIPPVGQGRSSNGFVFAEYSLMFDSLTAPSEDEPFSRYGLLADDFALAPDKLSVTFHLNPKAKFSNGKPVLAADVKYTFDTLMSKAAGPTFRTYWADVKQAVVVNERTVRFDFKRRNSELHMILGQLPIFSRDWGGGKPFDQITDDPPIASGPYVIDHLDPGKNITYKRNPDYWAKDLPARKGMFNWDEVTYQYFRDKVGEEESLKAGALDAMEETSIVAWVRRYKGKRFESGELVKAEIDHHRGTGMQGIVVNLRQPRFQDIRVREALILAFDFEWLNQRLFYGRRARTSSYFQNTDDLMAQDTLSADEDALLTTLKHGPELRKLAGGPVTRAPQTGGTAEGIRANLLKAQTLLAQAGYRFKDGALRDPKGEPFVINIDIADRSSEPVLANYARNLGRLGIDLRYRVRDPSLIKKKLDDFDFDMAVNILGGSPSPGNELYDDLGSKAAQEKGSQNLSGIADPVVDEIVEAIVNSPDRRSIAAGARVLDRYLLEQRLVVPMYYGRQYYIAHKRFMQHPPKLPPHMLGGSWILTIWWADPAAVKKGE